MCSANCAQVIARLESEVESWKKRCLEKEDKLKSFLNKDQIDSLGQFSNVRKWSNETIIKALKLRFSLGVHGYKRLSETGYPTPAYSTLTYRMREYKLDYGIFNELNEPLKVKLAEMDENDRFCVISIDEMVISSQKTFDKHGKRLLGSVTTDDSGADGKKLMIALIRGLKNNWKQVIGAHITPVSVRPEAMQKFLYEVLDFCIDNGLRPIALASDMGNENRALWKKLGLRIQRRGLRMNTFTYRDHIIHGMPDVCHIIKNLKCCMLNAKSVIKLPEEFCSAHNLPNNIVNGTYIKKLWSEENHNELRLLPHLKREDIFPDNFQKMHVGAAVRFFSLKTAAAIETAIETNLLPEDARTTAFFIRMIENWFSVMSSRELKKSITKRNKEQKYNMLETMINVIENTEFGDPGKSSCWRPLNTGIIMASLSFISICEILFAENYAFVLGSRLTQDAAENIFSQIRRKAGQTPTAFQCLQALKSITVSQYISDVKNSNYFDAGDFFLLDFFSKTSKYQNERVANRTAAYSIRSKLLPQTQFETTPLEEAVKHFTIVELNTLYYIAGSTTNVLLKKVCDSCCEFLKRTDSINVSGKMKIFKTRLTKGGLKDPSYEVLSLIFNCEIIHNNLRQFILKQNSYDVIISRIVNEVNITFPICGCNLKYEAIEHFFVIRSYCIVNLSVNLKRKAVYGSASAKKKKIQ